MCNTLIQRIKIILHYLVNTKTITLDMPTFKVLNKYKINTHKSKHYSTTFTQITIYLIKV